MVRTSPTGEAPLRLFPARGAAPAWTLALAIVAGLAIGGAGGMLFAELARVETILAQEGRI